MERTGNAFVDALRQEREELQNRLSMIDQLEQSYSNDPHNYQGGSGLSGRGSSDFNNQGNQGNQGNIRGSREINRNFSSSNFSNANRQGQNRQGQGGGNTTKGDDASQRVTAEGRVAHDADDVDPNTLQQWLNNPDQKFLNQDGSYDRRTMEGRALYAAGLIDEEGMPIGNKGENSNFNSRR